MTSLLLVFVSMGLLAAPPTSGPRLLHSLPIGGPGGLVFVSLDGIANRIYVHRSDRVMVPMPSSLIRFPAGCSASTAWGRMPP